MKIILTIAALFLLVKGFADLFFPGETDATKEEYEKWQKFNQKYLFWLPINLSFMSYSKPKSKNSYRVTGIMAILISLFLFKKIFNF